MFEIWKWLDSEKDFFQGIKLMEKYCPDHTMLNSLRSGTMSVMNRMYLEQILKNKYRELKDTPEKKVKKTPKPIPAKKPAKKLTQADYKRIADKELGEAYAYRRRLSNKFHECKTDTERAAVSDEIKETIQNINELKSRIGVYKTTGKMPEKITIKGFEIPEDDLELDLTYRNFKSKVSNQKRLIENYDKEPRRKSKYEHELTLEELKRKLQLLKNERDKRIKKRLG